MLRVAPEVEALRPENGDFAVPAGDAVEVASRLERARALLAIILRASALKTGRRQKNEKRCVSTGGG